jgi:hypothetical protein
MSGLRLLVGARKWAFVPTSNAKRERWGISGPHFADWEINHIKGSPADPNHVDASQSSSWFRQQTQRSNDGGKWLAPLENKPYQDHQAVSWMWRATHGG